jgi:intracellular sulfur oxidation DsrE/DsrF family protein
MTICRFLRRLALSLLFVAGTALADEPVKVVYHFSEGLKQASLGLHNIANHLDADPTVRIVAVAVGPGVDFLLDGAKDKNGLEYQIAVTDLSLRGVEFRVCNNTLRSRHIDPAKVDPDAKIVPSGVAEIANLQAKEHFVYIKP